MVYAMTLHGQLQFISWNEVYVKGGILELRYITFVDIRNVTIKMSIPYAAEDTLEFLVVLKWTGFQGGSV